MSNPLAAKNAGFFRATPELLAHLLALPYGTAIYGCEWDAEKRTINFFVCGHDSLPPGDAVGDVPEVKCCIQHIEAFFDPIP